MQLVQTRTRLATPLLTAFTVCRLGFHRRRVTLCACEILLPNCGPLPQNSHTCAITNLQNFQTCVAKSSELTNFPEVATRRLKRRMVGTIGLEPTTSTVSR